MDHNVASSMPPPELPPLKKPSSADAFGIMNLVFGIGGPLAMVASLIQQQFQASELGMDLPQPSLALGIFYYGTYVALAVWLVISGRKLQKVTVDCRQVFKWYCIASLVIRPLTTALLLPVFSEAFEMGAQIEMQKQPQRNDPDFERMMESILSFAKTATMVFMFIWSVVYELIGLWIITRPKVAKAYEAYRQRKGITG